MKKGCLIFMIGIFVIVGSYFAGYYYGKKKGGRYEIIGETKTVNRWIQTAPETYSGLLEWYNSPLFITGVMKGDWITIVATDQYKKATKSFRIRSPAEVKKNIILCGATLLMNKNLIEPGLYADYYRYIKVVYVGGGITYFPSAVSARIGVATVF